MFIATTESGDVMCVRYYIDEKTSQDLANLVPKISNQTVMKGDVRPTDRTMILHGDAYAGANIEKGLNQDGESRIDSYNKKSDLMISPMAWGFPGFEKQKILINARSETVQEKPTFRSSYKERRCIIPATGYYEWDKDKNKVQFERKDGKIIYMAGIWKPVDGVDRFVILTTEANDSVLKVHDRMPLILDDNEWKKWIFEESFGEFAIRKIPMSLISIREYEQLTLF